MEFSEKYPSSITISARSETLRVRLIGEMGKSAAVPFSDCRSEKWIERMSVAVGWRGRNEPDLDLPLVHLGNDSTSDFMVLKSLEATYSTETA